MVRVQAGPLQRGEGRQRAIHHQERASIGSATRSVASGVTPAIGAIQAHARGDSLNAAKSAPVATTTIVRAAAVFARNTAATRSGKKNSPAKSLSLPVSQAGSRPLPFRRWSLTAVTRIAASGRGWRSQ